jgi:hypothetical protein
MKKIFLLLLPSLFWFGCKSDSDNPVAPIDTKALAFPQAEGAGAYATGGRGYKVYYVTSLDDDGPGSLREGLASQGVNVLFAVSGTIHLKSPLTIPSYVTIAGQSAPGDGVTIADNPLIVGSSKFPTNDVIIRFIRCRLGDTAATENDAIEGQGSSNIMIDHCSMSWSVDECASFYDNKNMTMQWCLLAESLNHSAHAKGDHGYGGMWGGQIASFHHNLLAHHNSRTPRFCGARFSGKPDEEKVDLRNNVIYNWGGSGAYGGEGGSYNIVNNYYKPGPATEAKGGSLKTRVFAPDSDPTNGGKESTLSKILGGLDKPCWGKFYVSGNYMEGKGTNWDWDGIQPTIIPKRDGDLTKEQVIDNIKLNAEVSLPAIRTQTAQDAYNSVLTFVGASFIRDAVDVRVLGDVKNKTALVKNGIIDSQEDVGGFPVLNGGQEVKRNLDEYDTDRDGIPNAWEIANGLDPNNANDGKAKTLDPNGKYTNLEMYLNSLVKDCYPAGYPN